MLDEFIFGFGFIFIKGILKGFLFNFMVSELGFGLVKFFIFFFCNFDYFFI